MAPSGLDGPLSHTLSAASALMLFGLCCTRGVLQAFQGIGKIDWRGIRWRRRRVGRKGRVRGVVDAIPSRCGTRNGKDRKPFRCGFVTWHDG